MKYVKLDISFFNMNWQYFCFPVTIHILLRDMKKSILLLALLAIVTMAYPQTRRTSSNNTSEPANNRSSTSRSSESNRTVAPRSTEKQPANARTSSSGKQEEIRRAPAPNHSTKPASNARINEVNNREKANSQVNTPARTATPASNARVNQNTTERNTRVESTTPSRTRSENVNQPTQRARTGNGSLTPSSSSNSRRSTNVSTGTNARTRTSTSPARVTSEQNTRSRSAARVTNSNNDRSVSRESSTKTVFVKSPVVVRETRVVHHNHYIYRPIEYRRVHHVYRAPSRLYISWSNHIYNDFILFYPNHHHYIHLSYQSDRRIHSISAYDAMFHIGEVKKVYGQISEVYYSDRDDVYYLYIGGPFPYHDFAVLIEGHDYRRQRFPNLFRMEGRHIWSMGLITEFDEKPEVLVRKPYQLGIY